MRIRSIYTTHTQVVVLVQTFALLTFALTFSKDAGLTSEKHIKNTSWIKGRGSALQLKPTRVFPVTNSDKSSLTTNWGITERYQRVVVPTGVQNTFGFKFHQG